MISFKQLKITFDYPPEFDRHNHDLVAFIIQRSPRKVVATSVLTRASVDIWYNNMLPKYPRDKYIYLLGGITLMGAVTGISKGEYADDIPDEDFDYQDEVKKQPYGKKSKDSGVN